MADLTDEQRRTLSEVAYATELVRTAAPTKNERWWDTVLRSSIVAALIGGILAAAGNYCSQQHSWRTEVERTKQVAAREAAKQRHEKRLAVALEVQEEISKILVGSRNLAVIASGRFDGVPNAATPFIEAANRQEEEWRRKSASLELLVRLFYGDGSTVTKSWQKLREAVDAYIEATQDFYLNWRGQGVRQTKAQLSEDSAACSKKRDQITIGLREFVAGLQAERMSEYPSN